MTRARPGQALLAALATLVGAWPMTTLFIGNSWVLGTICLILLAALFGMAARALGAAALLTMSVQLIGVVTAAVVTQLPDNLNTSLPGALRALGVDANHTVTSYAAPAPTTPGIVFFLGLIVAIIAITVDFLAVTGRSPALAGLPLLVELGISAANSGGALHPKYFIALGLAWLAMLYAASARSARDWSRHRVNPAGRYQAASALGEHGFGFASRTAGALALVVAVVLAGVLPAASQTFVANGLGRGNGGGAGRVGFSTNLDLSRNLNDKDSSPVLTFRSTDPNPPPLRALVADSYDGDHWTPTKATYLLRGTNGDLLQRDASNPKPSNATQYRVSVTSNTLRPPYVAGPSQVRSAEFDGTTWSYDAKTSQPSTKTLSGDYSLDYLSSTSTARPSGQSVDSTRFRSDLELDPASRPAIDALVQQAAPQGAAFNRAVALQEYLRSSGGFTYSLTLAPTRKNASGKSLDPISNFLTTKQGYCMQFATAMTMAARSIGIPARLAVGFLPGTPGPNGVYSVKQSDAHAWPELYFPAMGWTRFEPTPASQAGTPPAYAVAPAVKPGTSEPKPSTAPRTNRGTSKAAPAPAPAAPATTSSSGTNSLHLAWLLWLAAGLGLLLAALSVLPLLARRSARKGHPGDGAQVQAQWDNLVSRMQDLGIEPAPPVSPRSQEEHYRRRLSVGPQGNASLHQAVMVMERARYTDSADAGLDLSKSADDLVSQVRATRSARRRMSATLFPRAGRDELLSYLPWKR